MAAKGRKEGRPESAKGDCHRSIRARGKSLMRRRTWQILPPPLGNDERSRARRQTGRDDFAAEEQHRRCEVRRGAKATRSKARFFPRTSVHFLHRGQKRARSGFPLPSPPRPRPLHSLRGFRERTESGLASSRAGGGLIDCSRRGRDAGLIRWLAPAPPPRSRLRARSSSRATTRGGEHGRTNERTNAPTTPSASLGWARAGKSEPVVGRIPRLDGGDDDFLSLSLSKCVLARPRSKRFASDKKTSVNCHEDIEKRETLHYFEIEPQQALHSPAMATRMTEKSER